MVFIPDTPLVLGRFTPADSSAKDGCYGTRTFAAWNGGAPFKYNARIEATWLDAAQSWLMSVIPSKAVALGYVRIDLRCKTERRIQRIDVTRDVGERESISGN